MIRCLTFLACILHEGNEHQGKSGELGKLLLRCSNADIHVGEGWTIARRCIAQPMHQGGSFRIGSLIFPDFVQVQRKICHIREIVYQYSAQSEVMNLVLPPLRKLRAITRGKSCLD